MTCTIEATSVVFLLCRMSDVPGSALSRESQDSLDREDSRLRSLDREESRLKRIELGLASHYTELSSYCGAELDPSHEHRSRIVEEIHQLTLQRNHTRTIVMSLSETISSRGTVQLVAPMPSPDSLGVMTSASSNLVTTITAGTGNVPPNGNSAISVHATAAPAIAPESETLSMVEEPVTERICCTECTTTFKALKNMKIHRGKMHPQPSTVPVPTSVNPVTTVTGPSDGGISRDHERELHETDLQSRSCFTIPQEFLINSAVSSLMREGMMKKDAAKLVGKRFGIRTTTIMLKYSNKKRRTQLFKEITNVINQYDRAGNMSDKGTMTKKRRQNMVVQQAGIYFHRDQQTIMSYISPDIQLAVYKEISDQWNKLEGNGATFLVNFEESSAPCENMQCVVEDA